MSKPKLRTVDVEIYDQRYSIVLKTPLPESEVRKLADHVDHRMREIAAQALTPDSLKAAILTALHLAHEYKELEQSYDQRVDDLSRALDSVLVGDGLF